MSRPCCYVEARLPPPAPPPPLLSSPYYTGFPHRSSQRRTCNSATKALYGSENKAVMQYSALLAACPPPPPSPIVFISPPGSLSSCSRLCQLTPRSISVTQSVPPSNCLCQVEANYIKMRVVHWPHTVCAWMCRVVIYRQALDGHSDSSYMYIVHLVAPSHNR